MNTLDLLTNGAMSVVCLKTRSSIFEAIENVDVLLLEL